MLCYEVGRLRRAGDFAERETSQSGDFVVRGVWRLRRAGFAALFFNYNIKKPQLLHCGFYFLFKSYCCVHGLQIRAIGWSETKRTTCLFTTFVLL